MHELVDTLPETFGAVVRTPVELDELYLLYKRGDKNVCAIISGERARDGYMKWPAVLWSAGKRAFVCPNCLEPAEVALVESGEAYY